MFLKLFRPSGNGNGWPRFCFLGPKTLQKPSKSMEGCSKINFRAFWRRYFLQHVSGRRFSGNSEGKSILNNPPMFLEVFRPSGSPPLAPRMALGRPRCLKKPPKWARSAPWAPRKASRDPQAAPRRPKTPPKWPKTPSRRRKAPPKTLSRASGNDPSRPRVVSKGLREQPEPPGATLHPSGPKHFSKPMLPYSFLLFHVGPWLKAPRRRFQEPPGTTQDAPESSPGASGSDTAPLRVQTPLKSMLSNRMLLTHVCPSVIIHSLLSSLSSPPFPPSLTPRALHQLPHSIKHFPSTPLLVPSLPRYLRLPSPPPPPFRLPLSQAAPETFINYLARPRPFPKP